MDTPKSKFVRDKVKDLPFTKKNRRYIENLLAIERYVEEPASGWIENMQQFGLRGGYPSEWLAIVAELHPEQYASERHKLEAEIRRDERQERAMAAAERREETEDRALWRKLGGKIARPQRKVRP